MSSRDLDAFTLRFFDPNTDDGDLDMLFDKAHRNRPAMVILEDIDRAFPRAGGSNCRLSLQHLLNTLDGVATAEGIVVVATANDPAVLDPAILRRPGRFDRVVHFANPSAELRLQYLRMMNTGLTDEQLRHPVGESKGLSFASLREAYVLSGQLAFERGGEVTEDDLLTSIRSLRQEMISSSPQRGTAGFGCNDDVVR
jgi:ATP-dependent 26S proteasome regulatory subunit